jgi:hypothetical protein
VSAERQPDDGPWCVTRVAEGRVRIEVDGYTYASISDFNARRILAGLSMVLGLPLSKAAQREIKL